MQNKVVAALVTGGAGFIGSHLVNKLVEDGVKVKVFDNLSSGNVNWVNNSAEFVQGELSNTELLNKATKDIDVVFHLAAMSRSGPSLEQPKLCLESNVVGTHNLLVAAEKNQVKKFIYSASSTCYGNQDPPHRIESNVEILNFYGLSKFYGEQETIIFSKISKMETISLRYFNVYGLRQPEIGSYALVLGIFLNAKLRNKAVEIHGTGKQTRDFINVSDVVEANIAAWKSNKSGRIYNVGSGKSHSIIEIAEILELKYDFTDKRIGDADNTLADISETIAELNWHPKISLETGINKLISDMRIQLN